jgi:sodium/hydrogen antiporter
VRAKNSKELDLFRLLAFNALAREPADATVVTVVLVVLGSIVIHGAGSPAVARMFLRSASSLETTGG